MNDFKIPLANPFRFVNANAYANISPKYNTVPFDMKVDALNPSGPYFQPWKLADVTMVQFNTDFTIADNELSFDIYKFDNGRVGEFYKNIPLNVPAILVQNVTWTLYEATVDFGDWVPGRYVGVISYLDQDGVLQPWQTSGLDVRVDQPKTLLYEYRNTYNDKGIVFDTGIIMSHRVPGLIRDFTPGSQNEEYVDQEYDTYSLTDIPFRGFANIIGSARGLPDWEIDKMNIIMSMDSVKIENEGYAKKSGQSFKMTRPTNGPNEDGYSTIEIIPNKNSNLEQYTTGPNPDSDLVVIAKNLKYRDNAANIAINGTFKTHTVLVYLAIWNKNRNAFTLKIGTTNGGAEIRQFDVTDDITSCLYVGKEFEAAESIFITGLDGTLCDVDVRYDDLDAPQSNPPGSGGGFVENVEYTYYEYTIGDFIRDFNVATGLGNPGTNFEGCALLDGQNGTINDAYNFRMGWDKTVPAMRGSIVGNANNQVLITTDVLPASGLIVFSSQQNNTPDNVPGINDFISGSTAVRGTSRNYEILKSTTQPDRGRTSNMGLGIPMDITPEALVVARFIKLPV